MTIYLPQHVVEEWNRKAAQEEYEVKKLLEADALKADLKQSKDEWIMEKVERLKEAFNRYPELWLLLYLGRSGESCNDGYESLDLHMDNLGFGSETTT